MTNRTDAVISAANDAANHFDKLATEDKSLRGFDRRHFGFERTYTRAGEQFKISISLEMLPPQENPHV